MLLKNELPATTTFALEYLSNRRESAVEGDLTCKTFEMKS